MVECYVISIASQQIIDNRHAHNNTNDQVWDLDMTNDPINVPWIKAFGSRGEEI